MRVLRETGKEVDILGKGVLIQTKIVLPENVKRIISEIEAAGYEALLAENPDYRIRIAAMPLVDVSSTQIREGAAPDGLLM